MHPHIVTLLYGLPRILDVIAKELSIYYGGGIAEAKAAVWGCDKQRLTELDEQEQLATYSIDPYSRNSHG